ncbi:MAG TPA: hypothetical protein VJT31_08685 [Rugosimonospora sp.]|nr:hypothetical protein [Rugosimonospora sp.]
MHANEPEVEGALVQLDDLTLEQLIALDGTVLATQLKRLMGEDPDETIAAFGNVL